MEKATIIHIMLVFLSRMVQKERSTGTISGPANKDQRKSGIPE
jgi:hypothetical protein